MFNRSEYYYQTAVGADFERRVLNAMVDPNDRTPKIKNI